MYCIVRCRIVVYCNCNCAHFMFVRAVQRRTLESVTHRRRRRGGVGGERGTAGLKDSPPKEGGITEVGER